jgi:branched-chain amino acid transport system permease protein
MDTIDIKSNMPSRTSGGKSWNRSRAIVITGCVLLALVATPLFLRDYVIYQVTTVLIYAIAILSLNILTGAGGQVSLGHSAFFAVGAFSAGIAMEYGGVNYALTLPLAGVVCFVFGFLFGFPMLRLKGVYLALATFSLAVAMPQFLKLDTFAKWTGGSQGLVLSKPEPPSWLIMGQDLWLYYFTLAVGGGIYLLSRNLLASRSGRAWMSIRDNPIAAAAMGIDTALYKTLAFGISAGIAGVAGALGAIVIAYIGPDSYTIQFSNALFLAMVVGGVGWLPGSLIGAAFIVFVPNISEGISKGLSGAVFGVTILAIIFFFPDGARQLVVSNPAINLYRHLRTYFGHGESEQPSK